MTNNEWLSMVIALREMSKIPDKKIAIEAVERTLDKIYEQISIKPENIKKD